MSKQTVNHQQQGQLIANSKDTESLYSTDWKHYNWIHFGIIRRG
jgi:hypothetical protein